MKGIFSLLFLTFSILSIAQTSASKNVEIDARLFEVYEKEYLTSLQSENPTLLQRWAYYLDNAYYITDYPTRKGKTTYPVIEIADLEKFNILLLEKNQKLARDFDRQMVYQIKGTNQVLVYYAGKVFNKKLNEHLGRKY